MELTDLGSQFSSKYCPHYPQFWFFFFACLFVCFFTQKTGAWDQINDSCDQPVQKETQNLCRLKENELTKRLNPRFTDESNFWKARPETPNYNSTRVNHITVYYCHTRSALPWWSKQWNKPVCGAANKRELKWRQLIRRTNWKATQESGR